MLPPHCLISMRNRSNFRFLNKVMILSSIYCPFEAMLSQWNLIHIFYIFLENNRIVHDVHQLLQILDLHSDPTMKHDFTIHVRKRLQTSGWLQVNPMKALLELLHYLPKLHFHFLQTKSLNKILHKTCKVQIFTRLVELLQ